MNETMKMKMKMKMVMVAEKKKRRVKSDRGVRRAKRLEGCMRKIAGDG